MTRGGEARKHWYFVPLPIEMEQAIDDIINKKMSRKYGIIHKAEMVRLIIGQFIRRYDLYGELPLDSESLRLLRPFELKDKDKEREEDKSHKIVK